MSDPCLVFPNPLSWVQTIPFLELMKKNVQGTIGVAGAHGRDISRALVTHEPWQQDKNFQWAQVNDPSLSAAWQQARSPPTPPLFHSFQVKNGLLYRLGNRGDEPQLLVPREFRDQILFFAHSSVGRSCGSRKSDKIFCSISIGLASLHR